MTEESTTFTASELDSFKDMIRVQTTLKIVQERQDQHEKNDEKIFQQLFNRFRSTEDSIHALDKTDQALMNKVDKLWLKIVLPIAGVVAAGMIVQYMLMIASLAQKL